VALVMLVKNRFYLRNDNTIVYILQTDESNFKHGDLLRDETGYVTTVYHDQHLKDMGIGKKSLLEANVVIENGVKKIYFPSLDRSLDYIKMTQEYIWEGSIWTQAQPYGYPFNIDLYIRDRYHNNDVDLIWDLINWLKDNFDPIDYEISKIFEPDGDIYEDDVVQCGYSFWFSNITHYNLTKLTFGNLICSMGNRNGRCS
jgi:hypothetical protein